MGGAGLGGGPPPEVLPGPSPKLELMGTQTLNQIQVPRGHDRRWSPCQSDPRTETQLSSLERWGQCGGPRDGARGASAQCWPTSSPPGPVWVVGGSGEHKTQNWEAEHSVRILASSALPGGKFYPRAHAGCDRSTEEAPCSDWGISAGSLLDG